ncbi:MAG: hypothetical protein ABIP51_16855 [Bacteroidia bacterium]
MKNKIILLFTLASTFALAQNVAINATGAAPVASAMLDISSTTTGLLMPRMTTAQRTAIGTPATGLEVYDTTTGTFWYFNGVVWVEITNSLTGWLTTGNTLTAAGIFGSISTHDVRHFSNNTERMRLISSGEFVINNTTATAGDLLSVYSTGAQWPINSYVSGAGAVTAGYFQNTSSSTSAFGVIGNITGGLGTAGVRGIGNVSGNGSGLSGIGQSATAFGSRLSNTNASGTGEVITGNNVAGSYLIAGSGSAITGSTTGVWGRTTDAANGTGGIFSGNAQGATNLTGGSGVCAVGTIIGVAGFASSTANATLRAGGYFETGGGQSFVYVGARTAGNVLRKIEGNGSVNTVVKDLNDKQVVLSCPEAPENLFQDFGQGQLVNGTAHIAIDPVFSKNIIVNDKHPLRVFVQLKGDCNGVFVTNETAISFDVVELKSGNSNTKFSYFITANRADEILPDGSVSKYSEERFAPSMGAQKTVTLESRTLNDKEEINNAANVKGKK